MAAPARLRFGVAARSARRARRSAPTKPALLGQALVFDPAADAKAPAKPLRASRAKAKEPDGFGVSRNDTPGGTTVVVKQPLPWDAKVGADLGLASDPANDYRPTQPLAPARGEQFRRRLGLARRHHHRHRRCARRSHQRSGPPCRHASGARFPSAKAISLTLQDSTSITECYRQPGAERAGRPADDGDPAARHGRSVAGLGQRAVVKFDILPTGTSLAAGLATSSIDPVTHNTFSADRSCSARCT